MTSNDISRRVFVGYAAGLVGSSIVELAASRQTPQRPADLSRVKALVLRHVRNRRRLAHLGDSSRWRSWRRRKGLNVDAREVRRRVARRLRPKHEPRPNRSAAVDQAGSPAPDDARQAARRLRCHGTVRDRNRRTQSCVASVTALARHGRWAHAVEEASSSSPRSRTAISR